jgi:N-dimethylarginine dimethylaminohydrolase
MPARFLVCPPAHFAVRDGVDAWSALRTDATESDAYRQWERFIELLGAVGDVQIERIEPADGLPELTFTANAALIVGQLAVISSFRLQERRREQSTFRAALARAGFATTFLRQTYFEGAGDALFDRVRPMLYVGYGWRSERTAALQLQDIVECKVLPLLMVDERFHHLETAFCPLGSGHVIAYMDAFSPYAQTLIRRAIGPWLIEVSVDDALRFACSPVEIGDALVMHGLSRRLRDRLHDAGYRVFCTELDAFHAAGASARSLTLRLNDGPVAGAASVGSLAGFRASA